MRPSVRAGLPARRLGGGAGRDLPPQARRRRSQGGHLRPAADARPTQRNGKRVACVGAGPASLTVARDLAAIGYEVVVFDSDSQAGGMMRSQIPKFRLPDEVIDEEVGYALLDRRRIRRRSTHRQPQGAARRRVRRGVRRLRRPARPRPRHSRPARGGGAISISASTGSPASSFGHITRSAGASSCSAAATPRWTAAAPRAASAARTSRSSCAPGFAEMKASPWEKEDAMHEGVKILNFLVPKAFLHEGGRLTGMAFEKVTRPIRCPGPAPARSDRRARRCLSNATTCWSRSARRTLFPGSRRDAASNSAVTACRRSMPLTFRSSLPKVFFGGDAAFGPEEHHHRGRAWP